LLVIYDSAFYPESCIRYQPKLCEKSNCEKLGIANLQFTTAARAK